MGAEGAKRTRPEQINGRWYGPNACPVCDKWLMPWQVAVSMDVIDEYCQGHEHDGCVPRSSLNPVGWWRKDLGMHADKCDSEADHTPGGCVPAYVLEETTADSGENT